MKTILALTMTALLAFAGDSPNFTLGNGVPDTAYTTIIHYTNGNADYLCKALSTQNVSTITVSSITNASPGVMTATAHGFYYDVGVTQHILVYITGATGGWSTLNGLKMLVPTSANAMAIYSTAGVAFNTGAFGTFVGQTIVVSTRAPKATSSYWAVSPIVYDASGNATILAWAAKPNTGQSGIAQLTGGTTGYVFPCSAPNVYE